MSSALRPNLRCTSVGQVPRTNRLCPPDPHALGCGGSIFRSGEGTQWAEVFGPELPGRSVSPVGLQRRGPGRVVCLLPAAGSARSRLWHQAPCSGQPGTVSCCWRIC